jgi:hypothetical protein
LCCRFPNRGGQNGQAAGRRTRAHRCRHRGRVCGHAGSARADGVKNKPWFVVGLDLRNTVRKQLSCGSCLSERGRCFFNIGTKFLQSFVFFKCGGSKARPNIIETASPYLPMRGLGCSGPSFTIACPFLLARRRYVALLILSTDRGRSLRGVVITKPSGHVVRAQSSSTVFSATPVSASALTSMSFGKPARAR